MICSYKHIKASCQTGLTAIHNAKISGVMNTGHDSSSIQMDASPYIAEYRMSPRDMAFNIILIVQIKVFSMWTYNRIVCTMTNSGGGVCGPKGNWALFRTTPCHRDKKYMTDIHDVGQQTDMLTWLMIGFVTVQMHLTNGVKDTCNNSEKVLCLIPMTGFWRERGAPKHQCHRCQRLVYNWTTQNG